MDVNSFPVRDFALTLLISSSAQFAWIAWKPQCYLHPSSLQPGPEQAFSSQFLASFSLDLILASPYSTGTKNLGTFSSKSKQNQTTEQERTKKKKRKKLSFHLSEIPVFIHSFI